MNYRGLELKLREIVEQRLEEGWGLEPGCYALHNRREMCLLSLLALDGNEGLYLGQSLTWDKAAAATGFDRDALIAVEAGFENWTHLTTEEVRRAVGVHADAVAIGARIRRDYCEWTNA